MALVICWVFLTVLIRFFMSLRLAISSYPIVALLSDKLALEFIESGLDLAFQLIIDGFLFGKRGK